MFVPNWSGIPPSHLPGSTIPTSISKGRLSILRALAVLSFTAYVYTQLHALSPPTPLPAIPKPYVPHEGFVAAFFAASALLNVYWLRQLFFKWDYAGDIIQLACGWDDTAASTTTSKAPFTFNATKRYGLSAAQVASLPVHILGNVFLTLWSLAWSNGYYLLAQGFLACNLTVQLYSVFILLHVEHDEFITPINFLTHIVVKTNAGLAILFMWRNWSLIDQVMSPQIAEMANSGIVFLLIVIGSGPDPILGICILYNLLALILGESHCEAWFHAFHWMMIVIIITLLVELHVSEQEDFTWLKGFGESSFASLKGTLPTYHTFPRDEEQKGGLHSSLVEDDAYARLLDQL
ncbi:hypothetical protein D9619_002684 [Psilocybe cf. subviscida]|uniref:Transmembrane protein n=1 Tax=Psilocybe cf. subviscida TaxID=2480587 RepID=A0A8H5ETH4_9AGAR|nr:hypothetical protein D9619_002684 [Psilocybe cf. subviscida]